jgi:diaminopimelate decarboxylase
VTALSQGAPTTAAARGTVLEPAVWPRGAARSPEGVLELAGVDVRDLAADFGTPAYVLDEADFRGRCREWGAAFTGGDVYYAGKAFLCTAVARWVAEEGLSLDVCTGGELAVALRAGFPTDRLLFHGNNKSVPELERAVAAGVGRIVVDSFDELARLATVADRAGVRQRVYVRVTPGVEAHTHEFVQTGQEDQKFGFSLASGAASEAVRRILVLPSLELVGIHCHIGSHIFDVHGFKLAAHRMVGLLAEIRDEHGVVLPELDLGGGQGIAYTAADDPMDVFEYADGLRAIVARECAAVDLPVPRLAVEPWARHRRSHHGDALRGRHRQGAARAADLRQRRRRHERQHPHRALRRPLHGGARVARLAGLAGQRHAVREALRERRHRRPRRAAALATSYRATCRRAGLRRLPPLDGQQLQPRGASSGWSPSRTARPACWSVGRPTTTCSDWTSSDRRSGAGPVRPPGGCSYGARRQPDRLPGALLVALLGVLLALGLAVQALLGGWAALAYAVAALLLVCVAAARARAAQLRARERARSASGRTCTCCTSTQHDPVKVI